MTTVMFLNNWRDSPQKLLERYVYQSPDHDGIWKNLQATLNTDRANHFVIMDGLPDDIDASDIPHQKKLFFQREPQDVKPVEFLTENAAFLGSYDRHYHLSTWQIRKPFSMLASLEIPTKLKKLSTIMSGKQKTPGQVQRLKVLSEVQKAFPEIDIFGRGLSDKSFGKSYKGKLDDNQYCKFNGLIDYKYSLALENSSHNNYFTEKLIDCFLTWTKPIYWGCPNVFDYFPRQALSWVDITRSDAVDAILEAVEEPIDYEALRKARELVLYTYNLWPSVKKVIDSLER